MSTEEPPCPSCETALLVAPYQGRRAYICYGCDTAFGPIKRDYGVAQNQRNEPGHDTGFTTTHERGHIPTGDYPWRDKHFLKNAYWNRGQTIAEIASSCGVSPRTIERWMNRFDIKRRQSAAEMGGPPIQFGRNAEVSRG